MAVEVFNLVAAAHMDGGRINVAFEQELRRAVEDCIDRPQVEGARVVTVQVLVSPTEDGDSVDVVFRLPGVALPKRHSRMYNMQPGPGGALLWNELSPEDVRQKTLDMVQKNKPKGTAAAEAVKEVGDVG